MASPHEYDFAVLGCGSMGSSALYQIAKRNPTHKVIGIEKFPIDQTFGSAGGLSRIIRKAYFESPEYVRLLNRSYDLYAELEQDITESNLSFPSTLQCTEGHKVLTICGGIDLGPPDSEMVLGAIEACKLNNLPYEILTSAQLIERFPGFIAPKEYIAVFQPEGGVLEPMKVNYAYNSLAREKYGADILTSTTITNVGYDEHAKIFIITTTPTIMSEVSEEQLQTCVITAKKIVISTGPWIKAHYASWDIFKTIKTRDNSSSNPLYQKIDYLFDNARMQVQRQVVNWHTITSNGINNGVYSSQNFPIFLIHHVKNYYNNQSNEANTTDNHDKQQREFINPIVSTDENGNLIVDASNTTKINEEKENNHFYYGFPTQSNIPNGMKIGRYHHLHEDMFSQDELSREVHYKDILVTAHCAKHFFPDVQVPTWYEKSMEVEKQHFVASANPIEEAGEKKYHFSSCHNLSTFVDQTIVNNKVDFRLDDNCISSCVCTFTNIADGHFLIQPLQYNYGETINMVLLSACSGHGFKFTSVIGEIVADMCENNVREDVKWLSAERVLLPE